MTETNTTSPARYTHRIEAADDYGCGVEIIRDPTQTGVTLRGIETGSQLGWCQTETDAIQCAGEYLMDYADDGVSEYDDPETGDTMQADWSATVEQGRRMVDGPEDYLAEVEADLYPDE